jgi:hypothetical protein
MLRTCWCAVKGHVWAVSQVGGAEGTEATNGVRASDKCDHVILVETLQEAAAQAAATAEAHNVQTYSSW